MSEKSIEIQKEELINWKKAVGTAMGAINLLILDKNNNINQKEKDFLKVANEKSLFLYNEIQKKVDAKIEK